MVRTEPRCAAGTLSRELHSRERRETHGKTLPSRQAPVTQDLAESAGSRRGITQLVDQRRHRTPDRTRLPGMFRALPCLANTRQGRQGYAGGHSSGKSSDHRFRGRSRPDGGTTSRRGGPRRHVARTQRGAAPRRAHWRHFLGATDVVVGDLSSLSEDEGSRRTGQCAWPLRRGDPQCRNREIASRIAWRHPMGLAAMFCAGQRPRAVRVDMPHHAAVSSDLSELDTASEWRPRSR